MIALNCLRLGLKAPRRQCGIALKQCVFGHVLLSTGERFPLEKVKDAVAASMKPARGGKVLLEG